jgi:hypothetical protein
MGKKLSQTEITTIYQLKQQGMSNRRVALLLNRCPKIINRFLQDPVNYVTRERRGRPRTYATYEDLIATPSISPASIHRFSPMLNSTEEFVNQYPPFSHNNSRCISPIPEIPSPISYNAACYEPPQVPEDDVMYSTNMLFHQMMLFNSLMILQKYQLQQLAKQEILDTRNKGD